jgi:hypothetical protein
MDNCTYIYQFNEIKRLWIISKNNVSNIKFLDDKRPEVGFIDSITYDTVNLIELQCDSDNTTLNQKGNNNSYDIELTTNINTIDYLTSAELQSYICEKFVVIFFTGEKQYFVFGVDEGAKLTYELNVSNNSGGYKISLEENNSSYPIFQASPSIIQ